MSKISTIALLALLGDCEATGTGSIKHVSSIGSMPRSNYTSANGLPAAAAMPHGIVPVDCPDIDPAQKRCSSGSGWTY